MEKKTYKDLNAKEALILRFFEIAATKAYHVLGGKSGNAYSKKGVLHAAWLYRKYLVALPESYPFLLDCYINSEDGEAYSIPQIQEKCLSVLMNSDVCKSVIGSIADGGIMYQGINYSLGVLEWSVEMNHLFKEETWHWKNDLTLTKVSAADAEGKEQLYVHVEFLNMPEQKPVILRRVGPFTRYVYRYSEAFDAETFEPVDISHLCVVRMRPRPANDRECDRLYF